MQYNSMVHYTSYITILQLAMVFKAVVSLKSFHDCLDIVSGQFSLKIFQNKFVQIQGCQRGTLKV